MEKKQDRRVQRTRYMVLDAFLDLMIEKGYDAITVQDVIDKANIGRSTFYLHFLDKEDLLIKSIEQLQEFIREQIQSQSLAGSQDGKRFVFSLAMLQHANSHKRIYKAIVGKANEAPVMQQMQQMLSQLIDHEISMLLPHPSPAIPHEIMVNFTVNTFWTVLSWWMEQGVPCSATDADRIFHALVFKGLDTFR